MKTVSRSLIAGIAMSMAFTSAACGSNMEGTYTQTAGAPIALDLRSGGKAAFTLMGETFPCTYKVKGEKLLLDCTPKGEKIDFTIHDDGSLTGGPLMGVLKKSK